MDTLCGIGLPELIIVTLIGFVVVGPERGRQLAVQLGKWLGKAMRSPWWKEFNQVTSALRNLPTTLVKMAELEETQAELQRTLRDIESETKIDFNEKQAKKEGSADDPWGVEKKDEDPASHKVEATFDLETVQEAPKEEQQAAPAPAEPEEPAAAPASPPEPAADDPTPPPPSDGPADTAGSEE